ncbi:MAG: ATP-binding protein [Planctomycetota bacterium]|nr:ATP-binding protein [Planctomycetota bacterium]
MASNRIRILLIEDDRHDVTAFGRAFKKAERSALITTSERAEDALKQLRTTPESFDIAVVDHKLPGISGMELCKTLLAEKVPLPLVILTGNGSEDLAVESLKAGVDDYVIKKPDEGYLNLVPLVLTEAVRKYEDRQARREAEESLRAIHSELLEKTAELERVNAYLSEYSSAVSHDLRAPLRAIHNYADFLQEDLVETLKGEQKEYLDGLTQAVRQAELLVTDLLAFCRLGDRPIEAETIDLGAFMRELVTSAALAPEVEIKMPDDWSTSKAPPALLVEIFQNLIENAIKFNQSDRKLVKLGWRRVEKERFEIFVRDNGIGIEPKFQQQIFGVFQRLHAKGDIEGTGIGLAIVKKAVTKLGGTIRVESTPGKGSTFFVTLPIKQEGKRHEQ